MVPIIFIEPFFLWIMCERHGDLQVSEYFAHEDKADPTELFDALNHGYHPIFSWKSTESISCASNPPDSMPPPPVPSTLLREIGKLENLP